MLIWSAAVHHHLDAVFDGARRGTPSVLAVSAPVGYGKSALLREAMTRAHGFRVLQVVCDERASATRFGVLAQLEFAESANVRSLGQAVDVLLSGIDDLLRDGPVCLLVDDAHWLDIDSARALIAVTDRLTTGHFAIVVTHAAEVRGAAIARLGGSEASRMRLVGFTVADTEQILLHYGGFEGRDVAAALHTYTGGSPQLTHLLLASYPPEELAEFAGLGHFPPIGDLVAGIQQRAGSLPVEQHDLLDAMVILGPGPILLETVVAVTSIPHPLAALASLRHAGWITASSGNADQVLITSHVHHDALYAGLSVTKRRQLHARAASVVSQAEERLRHRVAAAAAPSQNLIRDIVAHAFVLHQGDDPLKAASMYALAASVADDEDTRRQLTLDAEYERITARVAALDIKVAVPANADALTMLVAGHRLSIAKRWKQAAEVLLQINSEQLQELTPLHQFRVRVTRAWVMLGSGHAASEVQHDLQEAAAANLPDPAMQRLLAIAYGTAQQLLSRGPTLWGFDYGQRNRATVLSEDDGLTRLAWRGSVAATTGMSQLAIGDLTIVTDRIMRTDSNFGDGVFHALLSFAYYLRRQTDLAAATIEIPLSLRTGPDHPITAVVASLVLANRDEATARSREARLEAPLPAAIYLGDVADLLIAATDPDPAARKLWRTHRVADFGEPTRVANSSVPPHIWLLAQGIGAVWADDPDAAARWADRLDASRPLPWTTAATAWLRATRKNTLQLEAKSFHDIAALFAAMSPNTAGASSQGHGLLNERVLDLLTPRERSIAALLAEGLSYDQAAKRLFVTRSTISFHTTNIYSKAGVRSRHELVETLRDTQ